MASLILQPRRRGAGFVRCYAEPAGLDGRVEGEGGFFAGGDFVVFVGHPEAGAGEVELDVEAHGLVLIVAER